MKLIPIAAAPGGALDDAAAAGHAVLAEVLAATRALYARRGLVPPWGGYVAQTSAGLVGACGFAGPPAAGEVEVAYFTFPGHEGQGIATRMAGELLQATQPACAEQALVFIAHTLPQHGASTRILGKLGFSLVGPIEHPEDGTVWKWRRAPAPAPHP